MMPTFFGGRGNITETTGISNFSEVAYSKWALEVVKNLVEKGAPHLSRFLIKRDKWGAILGEEPSGIP